MPTDLSKDTEKILRERAERTAVAFARRAAEYASGERQWVAALRAAGVKAAHPDDGWVDREHSEVQFVYPQFNDGVTEGDVIALGWHDGHRLVRITQVRRSWSLTGNGEVVRYRFEEQP